MADDVLTTEQVVDLLKVDRTTVYRLLYKGEIPGFKVGRQWRFRKDLLERWMTERAVSNTRNEERK